MNFGTKLVGALVLTGLIVLMAVPALAHVGVDVDDASPGATAKYTVHVPNESDTAATIKVELQLPEEFRVLRHQPAQGWEFSTEEGVLTIEGGRIEPGQSRDFSFRAKNPSSAGDLTFPAIQTYDDGEEVRWTGAPGTSNPAPVVTISGKPVQQTDEPKEDHGHTGGASEAPSEVESPPTAAATEPAPPTQPATAAPAEVPASSPGTGLSPLVIAALIAMVLILIWAVVSRSRTSR